MNYTQYNHEDTICAISTPAGQGAIAIVRISGPNSIEICKTFFLPRNKKRFEQLKGHNLHFGQIKNKGKILDDVVLSVFKSPSTYTGQDIVEIACHGSSYIQREILSLCNDKGCRLAEPGEFTLRAFLNGKIDLTQAEAVADLIASENKEQHSLAINQMKGGITNELALMREKLIEFASLIELELDFAEEDVEFANREQLFELLNDMLRRLNVLIDSFKYGNAIKEGIPVVIVGKPNVGKSTLLNGLLKEERAIVSDIPGTTRDSIEEVLILNGIKFRFIDTAGIRKTNDYIEEKGIKRARKKIKHSKIALYMFDIQNCNVQELIKDIKSLCHENQIIILIQNKIDKLKNVEPAINKEEIRKVFLRELKVSKFLGISARDDQCVETIKTHLLHEVKGMRPKSDVVITHLRHKDVLAQSRRSLLRVKRGLKNEKSGDLLSLDLREAISLFGQITGNIDVDTDILGSIFSRFCIGK